MIESLQKRILQNLVNTLGTIESLNSEVLLGTFLPVKRDLPTIGVIPDEDVPELVTHDALTECQLRAMVRVVVDRDFQDAQWKLLDLLAEVEAAIMVDPRRGNLAMKTERQRTKFLYLDHDFPEAGADLELLVTYHRHEADPIG